MVRIKGSSVLESIRTIQSRRGADGYAKLLAKLDPATRDVFSGTIFASEWYPLDAFVRLIDAQLREWSGGDTKALVAQSAAISEKHLRGIYRIFIRLGSPAFVIDKIGAVHQTYFQGVEIEHRMVPPASAVIRYVGFERQHRLMEFTIIGFYQKALEISGAKDVRAEFTTPMGDAKGYAEVTISWRA